MLITYKVENLVIWLTEDCNLSCVYCHVRKRNRHFGDVQLQNLIRFIRENIEMFSRRVAVNFTGGEPLMRFGEMKKIVSRLNEESRNLPVFFQFGITTNGTLMNEEIADYLCKNGFSIIFSIDGNQTQSNLSRPRRNGELYDTDNLKDLVHRFKENGLQISARMTLSADVADMTGNLQHITSLGFDRIDILPDMEEIWEGEASEIHLTSALKSISNLYISEIRANRFPDINLFSDYVARYATHRAGYGNGNGFPCGSGRNTLSVSVNGDIYPCHRWCNQTRRKDNGYDPVPYRLGTLKGGIDGSILTKFMEETRTKPDECKNCSANMICNGPCYAVSHLYENNVTKPFIGQCRFMRSVDVAVRYVYSVLHFENEEIFRKMPWQVDSACGCIN